MRCVCQVPLITLTGHHEGIVAINWTEAGTLVTAGLDHTIRCWDLETQNNTQTMVR